MPVAGKHYAMNPQVAKHKAEAEDAEERQAEKAQPDSPASGLESIEIRPVENGYTVRCNYQKKDKKGGIDYEHQEHVFESGQAVLDFIEDKL